MAQHSLTGTEDTAERPRVTTAVRRLRDPNEIRALLLPQRGYAAYALGQLAPRLFPLVQCWLGEHERGWGLVLYSSGGLGEAMFMMGDASAVEAIVRLHRGPHQNFATCAPDHLPVLETYYRVAQPHTMVRMTVTRATFEPPVVPDGHVRVRRLRAADARSVNRLYNTEGAPTFYSAAHIESSYYHGAYYDDRLVAVAGTHVVSPEEGVAVVGNVFTHPRYRGRGYATLATGVTTEVVLRECDEVALTVDPRNIPAVRAYWRLGYSEVCRVIEAPVVRRDLFGLGAAGHRWLAAWRGRAQGIELVQ